MDEHGGALSYEGIKVLRKVESQGRTRFFGGLVPSDGAIRKAADAPDNDAGDDRTSPHPRQPPLQRI